MRLFFLLALACACSAAPALAQESPTDILPVRQLDTLLAAPKQSEPKPVLISVPEPKKPGKPTAWYFGASRSSGQYVIPTGYPGSPLKGAGIATIGGTVDVRGGWGFVNGSADFLQDKSGRYAYTATARARLFGIGPVQTGFGVQYVRFPEENYEIPTIAYARLSSRHDRQFGLGVFDLGVGSYNGSYVRGLFITGLSHTPTQVDIYQFDRPVLVRSEGFDKVVQLIFGGGGEIRFEPVRGLALYASAISYWRKPDGILTIPQRHQVFTGALSYYSPFHVGFAVSGVRSTDDQGIAFPNNTIRFSAGLTF